MDVNIKIVLDKRIEYKDGKYNLSIRLNQKKEMVYLPVVKLTEKEYKTAFVYNHMGDNCITLREKVNETLSRCEKICGSMVEFDGKRFKKLFRDDTSKGSDTKEDYPKTLALKSLFEYFIKTNDSLKVNTKKHIKTSMNIFEKYDAGVTVYDITPKYLLKFEQDKISSGSSNLQGLGSYMRDLRRLINYFTHEVKIIPKTYEYPFGRGGYSIKEVRGKKMILSEDEIRSIMELNEFESDYQEYARDIWLTLYYANGINFVDLLRMRWDDRKGNHISIFRKKTETTQKKLVLEIIIPLTQPLIDLINKVGNPTSPFVLGLMNSEVYSDETITNRKNSIRQDINPELRKISNKLKLSVPLTMETARDCYASTLKRRGYSRDVIAEQLGHSDIVSTGHYVDSLGVDDSFRINETLVKKREPKDVPENTPTEDEGLE